MTSTWSTEANLTAAEAERVRPQLEELERWVDTLPDWAVPVSITVRIEGRLWQHTRFASAPGTGKA